MKVLQINVVCGHGSTGRIAVEIANTIQKNGDCAYIAYGFGDSEYSGAYRISSDSEYRINARFFSKLGLQGRGTKYGTKRFLNWIEEVKPDIIHLHNIHGMYVNYQVLFEYLIRHNIPVVWTIHDCWPITGHCAHFVLANCNKWRTGCYCCDYKGIYKEASLIDNTRSTYELKKKLFCSVEKMHIVTVSKWMNKVVEGSFLSKYPSSVIYNGIDLNIFKYTPSDIKQRLGIKDKILLLGVATQWNDEKGFSDYLRLAKCLNDKYVIVLVGLTLKQMGGLPDNIIGLNKTKDRRELVELYSAANIVLSLSYAESMGLTLVESLACGTPVVSYDNTAQSELVNYNTGCLVKTGDINGTVSSIETICQKGKDYYSEECKNWIVQNFDKNDRYQDYYKLYCDVLKGCK